MSAQASSFMQDNLPRPNNLAHLHRDRGYRFVDRDPVMAEVTAAITKSGRSLHWISARSGVSVGTLQSWMNGTVRRPQHLTITFVMRSLGFENRYVSVQKELPKEEPSAPPPEPITVDDVFVRVKPRIRDQFLGRIPEMRARREERRARKSG